jgi:Flp pilus assembly protein TadG
MVEFALVAILLFMLLFGIVGFGVLLSFKQTLTQAANEAAREAAVTVEIPSDAGDERVEAAERSVQAFESWGRTCGSSSGDVDCSAIVVHDCGSAVQAQTTALPDCITVSLSYDYGAAPIIPHLPIVDAFMPDTVESSATAQLTFLPDTTP